MKLQFFLLILPVLMAATAVKGFDIRDRMRPNFEYPRPMEQMIRDYPAASRQDHIQPEQALAMAGTTIYSVGVESLTPGQTVEVVYLSPSAGRVFVNLVTKDGDVALHVDARYDITIDVHYEKILILSIYTRKGGWQRQAELHNFPFPTDLELQRTRITTQIAVRENDFVISVNGVELTTFAFRDNLTPDIVRKITVTLNEGQQQVTTPAELEKVSVSF